MPRTPNAMLPGLTSTLRPSSLFGRATRAAPARAGWFARDEAIMGTAIRVELWCDDRACGEAAIDAVMQEMHRIDRAMSPYKADSELSRLNREAAFAPVPVSEELFGLVAHSIGFSKRSGGAFDITYAGVGHLYDYRRRIRPSDEAIARARAAVGYRHLILDERARTIGYAREGVRIDLGGFAKGHAVESAAAILAQRGIEHAIVTAGGDSRLLGDRRGRPWNIAIRDPRRAGEVVALLPLEDAAISTSGDYERFFDEGGVRHHHLLDPRTGRSPGNVHSVTIVAADGLTSEALSKTVFVLGVERGLALIDATSGVDAVVIDAAGALHYSCGLLAGASPSRQ